MNEQLLKEFFDKLILFWYKLTPEDVEKISILLHQPQYYHIESMADALSISRTQVYRLKRQGIIPPPKKIAGLKEKVYTSSQVNSIRKQLAIQIQAQNSTTQ